MDPPQFSLHDVWWLKPAPVVCKLNLPLGTAGLLRLSNTTSKGRQVLQGKSKSNRSRRSTTPSQHEMIIRICHACIALSFCEENAWLHEQRAKEHVYTSMNILSPKGTEITGLSQCLAKKKPKKPQQHFESFRASESLPWNTDFFYLTTLPALCYRAKQLFKLPSAASYPSI